MAGFASPAILYLSTWDSPERKYCRQILSQLRDRGYTRFVDAAAGAFAMPLIAQAAGWKTDQMWTSDTGPFSAIIGTLLDPQRSFSELGFICDGEVVEVSDDPEDKAKVGAHLMWLQLLTRLQAKPEAAYWDSLITDLQERQDGHERAIRMRLESLQQRLGGLYYIPRDTLTSVGSFADDPKTVIALNPPTYQNGFEVFFDTKGRLSWNGPDYEVWNPARDLVKLQHSMETRSALLICQQQREPRAATHPVPIFARHLSLGQNVYIVTNRPGEIFEFMGGPKVAPHRAGEILPADVPPIELNHEITEKSTLEVMPVKAAVADYYRGLWMHRLHAQPGSYNLLVVVDGRAAGIIGYGIDTLTMPYSPQIRELHALLLRFAIGAPHESLRLTRLATLLSLQRQVASIALGPPAQFYLAASDHLVTVEMTRYPVSKGLRGLFKGAAAIPTMSSKDTGLVNRQDHPDGYKLTYASPWEDGELPDVLATWLKKEAQWRRSSKKGTDDPAPARAKRPVDRVHP